MRTNESTSVSNVLWSSQASNKQPVLTHTVTRSMVQRSAESKVTLPHRYGPLPGEVFADEAKYGCFS